MNIKLGLTWSLWLIGSSALQFTRSCAAPYKKNGPTEAALFSDASSRACPVSARLRVSLTAQPVEETPSPEEDATTEGVFGAAALVAGNMVGGGILAIPTVCAGPGFYPAAALTICLWAANVGTGLLLGEVAAAAVRRGDEDVSLRALSRDALGESGAQLTSAFFVITNLMLMGAYVAAGGDALGSADGYVGHRIAFFLAATLLAGAPSVLADAANSGLVVAMVGALGALLVLAAPSVDLSLLVQPGTASEPDSALMTAAPILLGALVFQNVVPIIAKRFKGDTEKIRESVVLGSAAPAVAYIAFCASVLGRPGEPAAPGELLDAARGLPDELRGPACAALAVFSVTAVATSFTGAAVGQLEEIRGLVGDDDDSSNEAIVAAACFLPPLALALSGPNVFLPLLSLTGGYANTYLFGLLPCLLAWKHREASEAGEEILPGGRYSLSALGSGAATMVVSARLGDAAHAISTAVPHV